MAAKKETPVDDSSSALSAVVAQIQKQYGEGAIVKLGDAAADPEFVGTVRGVFPRFSIGSSVPPAAAGAPVPGSASRSRVGSWKLTTENSSPSLMVPVAAPHSPCAFP